ncbi:MAG TPA: histidine kinase N-terminal 7TM domain-containing protein [Pseudomonadales bacterium]|nr:histidine kinase N-terminal 7TM domain-containing protein [Pseudomonadales bacterium]
MTLLLAGPLLLSVPVAFWLLTFLYRSRHLRELPLMLLIGGAAIWAIGYSAELLLPTLSTKMMIVPFEYLGIVIVPFGWLLLGLQLHDQLHRIKPWMIPLLLVIPAITLVQVCLWQSPWNFYWSRVVIAQHGTLKLIDFSYGPFFWVHIVYSYLLQAAGGIMILASILRSSNLYTRQRLILALALFLPWTANGVYIFRLMPIPFDATPLAIIVSSLLVTVSVFRYGLGDLVPIAREKIFSQMREGVMVFDDRRRLVDANDAALQLIGTGGDTLGKRAESLFARHRELLGLFEGTGNTDLLYSGFNGRAMRVTSEEIGPGNRAPSRLLIFNDLSVGNRIEATLRLVVESTSADTGEDFMRSLTQSLAMALGSRSAFIGVRDASGNDRITTLAFWERDGFRENFSYDLSGSPCETLLSQRTCVFQGDVQSQFPADRGLAEMGVTSYIGTRLTAFGDNQTGVLVVMNDKPFANVEATVSVLEVFAIRAASELEREHTNARLQESEARYRRMVETTRDGVCVVDAGGKIEFLNEPMAVMIGASKNVLLGETLSAQFHIVDGEESPLGFSNDTVEAQLVCKDGRKLWVAISKTVIEGSEQAISGALMMFTDITESRLLEEQNTRIELQLQHAQKLESLGVLAGGIAHDFNNLLMPILGYLDLIQDRTRNDAQVSEYLGRMRDAGGKLADLCNQMLTYSGRGQFVKKALDLNEMLSHLGDLIHASTSKSVQIEYKLARELPRIRADETQLDQIMINLVINASEAMSELTAGRMTISTGEETLDKEALKQLSNGDAVDPGRFAYVEVTDEGSGIAERDMSRLFEPFFTTKFTGRGLGMAVVFGIVKGHRGAIRVTSRPGIGTSIRIYFPVSLEEATAVPAAREKIHQGQARGLVLVVDDEDMVRNIICNILEVAGFSVVTASNGVLGGKAFMENRDRLVGCVVDVTMPEMDGYGLLANIQSARPDIPVVLVSGFHAREFEDRELDKRHVTFLQKPFDSEALIAALATDNEPTTLS